MLKGLKAKLFLIAIIAVAIGACRKNNGAVVNGGNDKAPDIVAPILAINSPVSNQQYPSNKHIVVTGTATDKALSSLQVQAYNVTDAVKVYDKTMTIAGTGATINQSFLYDTDSTYKICLVVATVKDITGNTSVDSTFYSVK